jgi:hypothetical protein
VQKYTLTDKNLLLKNFIPVEECPLRILSSELWGQSGMHKIQSIIGVGEVARALRHLLQRNVRC